MKSVASIYTSARAVAFICATLVLSQYETHAFVPTATKGREIGSFLSSTLAPTSGVKTAKSTRPKSGGKGKPRSTKRKGNKQNKKNRRVVIEKGTKRAASKNVPRRKKLSDNAKSFKPLKDLKLGSEISGRVVDVCEFGAFVSIGYATRGSRAGTALLHISQISDKKIDSVRDVIKVGDEVEGARVISVDVKKGEVGLSLRPRRPKRREFSELRVGSQLEGKVDSVLPYGVFVDVGANVNGLLHISRITGGVIENVRHHLNEGDAVSVHVIDIDKKKKTMAVSMLDKKADQYLDRRMSQRLKKYYGPESNDEKAGKSKEENESQNLVYFDIAIRELEEALRGRED